MATKLTLFKGPALQKLLVLVLLTFAGLGYPPKPCEAIKCMSCSGDIRGGREECVHKPELEDCSKSKYPNVIECNTVRFIIGNYTNGRVQKGCPGSTSGILSSFGFECVQRKLYQTGTNCIKAPVGLYFQYWDECEKENGKSTDGEVDKEARQNKDKNKPADEVRYWCKCFEDFCNEKDALPSLETSEPSVTPKGHGGNGGGASGVVSGNKVVLTGGFGLMVMRLVTNFIV